MGRFKTQDIPEIIAILRREYRKWKMPSVTHTAERSRDPFKVLISTILSLRTKDETTSSASKRLFKMAENPRDMLALSPEQIEKAIYPVGFYRSKAKIIRGVCETLIERYDSRVPDDIDELLKLKGVGRKTANLVVTLAYGKPGVCVDTHVHRISNRWGYIETKTPFETEMALRERLPERYWVDYNSLLVAFGQTICRPISPKCTECPVETYCEKVGVMRNR
ncbi:MAG: endonuclease III [Thermodesulfobacteriota bacterium]